MAGLGTGPTKVSDLIVNEVVADSVRKKLGKLIKFAPLADLDSNLQGTAGTTIILPSWNYIGDASDMPEGQSIPAEKITAGSVNVTIKKAVKDISMTDESVLATGGAVVGEVEHQLAVSIANKIDEDMVTQATATAVVAGTIPQIPQQIATANITQAGLATLRVYFGEDLDETFLIISVADYGKVLSMPEFVAVDNGSQFMSGHVGHVMGLQIVVSGRLASGKAVLLQQGGLGLAVKRDVNTESTRDMTTRSTRLGVDSHYACFVKNPAKVANIVSLT